MSYYPVKEGEVHVYKQSEEKILADKAKQEAHVMEMKDALSMSEFEGTSIPLNELVHESFQAGFWPR
jgi:hypothetical protein